MDFEYVYLQKNPHIPKLLKLGYTKNDPADRAKQLSAPTGVPGRYEVIKYWQVRDGHRWEQFIFAKLSKHNPTGEFLDLPAQSAVDKIDVLLSENGALSDYEAHKLLEAKQRETADSFDNGRLRDKLIPLQRKLTDLDRETDRLFEKAKQNFYKTGYQSDTFHKPSNFGAYFTSSTSSEHGRHATSAPSYSFKNKTGKPPDLILKCPFCQAKNRWTRKSFVGGRIKCGSCSRQWEVDELGEEVAWKGL